MTCNWATLERTVGDAPLSTTSMAYRRGPREARKVPERVAVSTLPLGAEAPLKGEGSPSSLGIEPAVKSPIRVTVWSCGVAGAPKLELIVTFEKLCPEPTGAKLV